MHLNVPPQCQHRHWTIKQLCCTEGACHMQATRQASRQAGRRAGGWKAPPQPPTTHTHSSTTHLTLGAHTHCSRSGYSRTDRCTRTDRCSHTDCCSCTDRRSCRCRLHVLCGSIQGLSTAQHSTVSGCFVTTVTAQSTFLDTSSPAGMSPEPH